LRDVYGYEVFGELAKSFAYIMQRAVFAVLEDNVEIFPGFHKPLVFYDVGMLGNSMRNKWRKCQRKRGANIEIFEKIDLNLYRKDKDSVLATNAFRQS
jgi:hypothetical protein